MTSPSRQSAMLCNIFLSVLIWVSICDGRTRSMRGGPQSLRIAISKNSKTSNDTCMMTPSRCVKCELFDKHCGGVQYQLFRFYVAPWLNRSMEIVMCDGNAMTKPNSTMAKLNSSAADISLAYMTISYDRAVYLGYSFPMWFTRYTAIVYAPPRVEKTLDFWTVYGRHTRGFLLNSIFYERLLKAYIYAMLIASVLTYLFFVLWHYPDRSKAVNFFHEFNWIVINVFIAYAGSIVTIAFYAPSASPLPFNDFDELADGLVTSKFHALYLYDITKQNVFEQPGLSGILTKFNEAYKIHNITKVKLDEGMQLVLSNKGYVLLTADHVDLEIIRNRYCGFLEIPDTKDLKQELHGFYMSRNSGIRFGWYERHVLINAYMLLVKDVYYNGTHQCMGPQPAESVHLGQLSSLFWLFLATLGACSLGLVLEMTISFSLCILLGGPKP